jgi:CRP-like cAMP-binding protein
MSPSEIPAAQLRTTKCLSRFTDADCNAFLGFVELENHPQDTVLFREGDPGDFMYLILEGQVRVFTVKKGKPVALKLLAQGDAFGDIALFNHTPRLASVETVTQSKLLKLTEAKLKQFQASCPAASTTFLQSLAASLTQMYADFRH